jgi:hypothetical protein
MVQILSISNLIGLLPSKDYIYNPFSSIVELLKHLEFAFLKKNVHQFILKSSDNQSFCSLREETYERSTLLQQLNYTDLPSKLDEAPQIDHWDSRLDIFFKSIQFEKAQYFSI